MTPRCFATTALTASLSLALAACSDATPGDTTAEASGEQQMADAGDAWTVPRTPWGDPDLRGTWPLDSVGQTPMQRPVARGEQAYLTDEEYAALIDAGVAAEGAYDAEDAANRIGTGHWFERERGAPLRQTSLIMEPADGRIPAMTEEAAAIAANMKSSWSQDVFEWVDDFNALDHCITRGMPASMIPFPYNNGVEVYQSPGYVVIRLEMVHETRIIPLDGRPALPSSMTHWMGESRGHWEGDTLVIETANFNGLSPMVIVGPSNEPVPTSTSLKITERLTPTGPDTIQYEAVVEDPEVITGPFTLSFPWTRDEGYDLYEYACHEGNTVVRYYIQSTSPRYVGPAADAARFTTEEWLRVSGVTSDEDEGEE